MTQIPPDIWAGLQEYERMMDELEGIPPIARGQNPGGVRSAAHANSLIRQFSPRFKDRALLIERDVESLGALMLDLARAHDDHQMIAWVPKEAAGAAAPVLQDQVLLVPPAEGLVPVPFTFAELDENATLTVDSHSSSPAFAEEAKGLAFDLLKIGAMDPSELLDHVDVGDPEDLRAGITRREIARAKQMKEMEALQVIKGGKK